MDGREALCCNSQHRGLCTPVRGPDLGAHPSTCSNPHVIGPAAGPKDVRVLIPRPCENVTSHGRRDFVGVIKDLEMGDDSELSRWA